MKKLKCISKFIKNVYKVNVELFTKSRVLKLRFYKKLRKGNIHKILDTLKHSLNKGYMSNVLPKIIPAYLEWQVLIF